MSAKRLLPGLFLIALVLSAPIGCSDGSKKQSSKKSSAGSASKSSSKSAGKKSDGAAKSTSKTESAKKTTAKDTTPDTPPKPDKKTSAVLLGSPELTAGIPGEGKLTIDQIKPWIDDPDNHVLLEPQLPFGLVTGQEAIVGLDKNPLTRAKIELGRQLYFDRRLSADATVSCADCHHPDEGYARHTQFGVGINKQEGNRNSPVSYNRILSAAQFWDGRTGSLEEQAVGPIANPIEMGNTHAKAVETVKGIDGYKMQFAKIFDDGVTIENIGKAIATFERAIVTGPSPFDYYDPLKAYEKTFGGPPSEEDIAELKEDDPAEFAKYQQLVAGAKQHPMSESAKRGHTLFFTPKANCVACHLGANLADEKYHNLGVGMSAKEPDLGRFAVTKDEKDKGAFKTPTIRNVALTAPYMHDGSQKTLAAVVEWYDKGGHANPHLSDKIRQLKLTEQEKKDLVEFMKACTSEFPKVETERLP